MPDFLDPSHYLNEYIKGVAGEFNQGAYQLIDTFALKDGDFNSPIIAEVHTWVLAASFSVCGLLLVWRLFTLYFQSFTGGGGRSVSNSLVSTISGIALAVSMPWVIQMLLKLNSAYVEFVLSQGIETKNVEVMAQYTGDSAAVILSMMGFSVLYLILGIQFVIRYGELILLMIFGPVACVSMTGGDSDMNIMPAYIRELIAVIFSQALQITILAIVLRLIGGGTNFKDFLLAIGLMIVLLKGPSFLRQMLYSTGSGRAIAGAAGSAGSLAVKTYMTKAIMKK